MTRCLPEPYATVGQLRRNLHSMLLRCAAAQLGRSPSQKVCACRFTLSEVHRMYSPWCKRPTYDQIKNGSHISQACLQGHARLTFSAALQRCGKPSRALLARSKTTPAEKTSLGLMCFRCWSTWFSRRPRTLARKQEAAFPFRFRFRGLRNANLDRASHMHMHYHSREHSTIHCV